MTPDTLAALAGALLSLCFAYIPGLSTWYAAQLANTKRLIMLAALALTAGAVFGFGCLGWAGGLGLPVVACDRAAALEIVRLFILAMVANQAAFTLSPKPAPYDPVHARPLPFVDDGEGDGYTPR